MNANTISTVKKIQCLISAERSEARNTQNFAKSPSAKTGTEILEAFVAMLTLKPITGSRVQSQTVVRQIMLSMAVMQSFSANKNVWKEEIQSNRIVAHSKIR